MSAEPKPLVMSDILRDRANAVRAAFGQGFVALSQAGGFDPARDWCGANLRGVDFGTDDLAGFRFLRALLHGADLSQARGLRRDMFHDAGWDETTRFPPDLHMPLSQLRPPLEPRVLDAESWPLLATLKGHEGEVYSVGFSPDGARLVSGSHDGTLRLWDAASGAPLATLTGHKGLVSSVGFSPDGARLVSGGDDRTVRLWDAASGALRATLKGHRGWVRSVGFSPDGTRLVSGGRSDGRLRLWDAASGALLATLTGHEGWVFSVGFSPDGARLVSGSWDCTVRLWDAASGAPADGA